MTIQTKTMVVKSDTALAETKTTIRDTVTFDTSKLPNGITYKGLKAVLSFADPIQWNKASTYDSLTVVWDDATHASYASKRPVPQNIELTNEFYWFRTADLDAQVEMYRQEVQQFDGRITANAQAIAVETARAEAAEQTLQENINGKLSKETVLIIGNSYTVGYNQVSENNSLKNNLSDIFDNYYCYGEPAAGFVKHYNNEVDKSFNEMLIKWPDTHSNEQVNSITRVIFNIAVGDSFAYIKNPSGYATKFGNALAECKATIERIYPNVKNIGVMYMDALYNNTRTFTDTDNTVYHVKLSDMGALYRILRPYCVDKYHVDFYGWCGWSLVNTGYMNNSDNIHPSADIGYPAMTNAWKQAYLGILDWRSFSNTITIPVDDATLPMYVNVLEPNVAQISFNFAKLGRFTPTKTSYSFTSEDLPLSPVIISSRFYMFFGDKSLYANVIISDKVTIDLEFTNTNQKDYRYDQIQLLPPYIESEVTLK